MVAPTPSAGGLPGSATRSPRRLAPLDGLRGLAALSVFVFHAWLYTLPNALSRPAHSTGEALLSSLRVGLALFFVLSAFLLYSPWARAGLTAGRRGPDLASYAWRRVARILPGYYVALIGAIVLLWPIGDSVGVRLPDGELLPTFLFFGQNFFDGALLRLDPPMWTLAVEVTFYLALPAIGVFALRLPPRLWAQLIPGLLLLLLGFLWNLWLTSHSPPAAPLTKVLPAMLPYFALGMLTTTLLIAWSRMPRWLAWAAIPTGVALVVANAFWHSYDVGPLARAMRDLPAGVGFALIIAGSINGALTRPLSWKPLAWVGIVSYGFYLWHVPVLVWLRAHGLLPLDWLGATLVALPISLGLGAASWYLIERPAIRWAHRRRTDDTAEQSVTLARGRA